MWEIALLRMRAVTLEHPNTTKAVATQRLLSCFPNSKIQGAPFGHLGFFVSHFRSLSAIRQIREFTQPLRNAVIVIVVDNRCCDLL